jgi:hypothetical protein
MDSKAPKMNKQSTTGKRKHGTLILQKIEIIRGLKEAKTEKRQWFHPTWDHQLCMM